jgi:integrase
MPEFLSGGREFKSLQAHQIPASRVSGSFPKPETKAEAKKMRVRGSFSTRFGTLESQEKQGSGLAFQDFLQHADYLSNTISKNKLEQLRTIVSKAHERRFRRRKEPRYGSINKGFTEPELQRFFRTIASEKFSLLFKYQAHMGLRVGEVCQLHISNIDFDKRELTINSEKSGHMDSLIIPLDLFKETVEFMNKHQTEIKAAEGYIFYKENDNGHTGLPYINLNYVRNVFREVVQQAGLNQTYATSEEAYSTHRPRPLHRLTTHSLRHYAITRFAKSTNGNIVLASRFARHSSPSTTMRYIAKDKDELYKNIDFAFSDKITPLKALSKSIHQK